MPGADTASRAARDERPDAGTPDDDAELARRAALGDRDAFTSLVDRHGPAMYRYAVRMLDDRVEAEDAVQDALVAAWTGLDRWRGDASVKTWLFAITGHQVGRRLRRRRPIAVDPSGPVLDRAAPDGPVEHSMASALREAVEQVLHDLPRDQRAVWLLAEVERLSYREIAEVTASTPDAVRGRLARARATVGRRLAPWR